MRDSERTYLLLREQKRRAARSELAAFAKWAMPSIQLTSFHRSYYRVLDAFAKGRIRKLMVSIPPQHGKSLGSTQLLPAFMLGLDPDLHIAIASYSAALASKFNKRVQRIITDEAYTELFPGTTLKNNSKSPRAEGYAQTFDLFEIVDRSGFQLAAGREGALTGNEVDCFILDDLYKDAMEANSPVVRENCWEWYTSVVKTRLHNQSQELMVFTRWHEDDLMGTIMKHEPVEELRKWSQLDTTPSDRWLHLNLEAIKEGESTEIDPREQGAALWPERHCTELLNAKRRIDRMQFDCMYQGRPSSKEGLLYGDHFRTYSELPADIVRRSNYTDTADTGDDHLCSICYCTDVAGNIYVTDVLYTQEAMEETEPATAAMLKRSATREAVIESNNGGRGFARAVQRLAPDVRVEWFHQHGNKEARILTNAQAVVTRIYFPEDWKLRWERLHAHITTYKRLFRANRWHDAPDVLTGIIEREMTEKAKGIRHIGY